MYSAIINSEIFKIATFQLGWNSMVVVISTTMLGVASGLIGTFIVLQKRSLVADALSHCTLPGVCLFFILGKLIFGLEKDLNFLLLGAALSGGLGLVFLYSITSLTRLREDVATALSLSVFFGFGVLLLSYIQTMGLGGEGGIHHYVFGQTASMRLVDAYTISFVALLVFVVLSLFQKELFLVAFDREYAQIKGFSPALLDALSLMLLILVVLVGIQAVGMLLIVSFIVMPSVSARFWTNDSSIVLKLSAFLGALAGYVGSVLSATFSNVPAGALIVLVSGLIFLGSFILAPERGLVSSFIRLWNIRFKVEEDHILRDSIDIHQKLTKNDQSHSKYVSIYSPYFKKYSLFSKCLILALLGLKGYLFFANQTLYLSPKGFRRARKLERNRLLWEKYLESYSGDSLIHLEHSTDLIEHVLSPNIVNQLNHQLNSVLAGDEG